MGTAGLSHIPECPVPREIANSLSGPAVPSILLRSRTRCPYDAYSSLAYLDEEVASNREMVRDLLPYHQELAQLFLEVLTEEGEASLAGIQESGFQGFRPPGFVRAAWEAALAGGVPGLMDFEDVSLLGQVYSKQDRVDRLSVDGLQAMLGPGAFRPDNLESLITQALGHTNDLVFAQQELLDLYDAWLAHRGR